MSTQTADIPIVDTRRRFLARSGAALVLAALGAPVSPRPAAAAPAFEAYHGVDGAAHQSNFNRLVAQHYRIISLSVYGEPEAPLYAAVWVRRDGPRWIAVHGVDAEGYQTFFNSATASGFAPVSVCASGTAARATFAAVFEQGVNGPWTARHGMTFGSANQPGTFQFENAAAGADGRILRSVAIYGSPADRRYAAIWQDNQPRVAWRMHPAETSEQYQRSFNAETQGGLYRPAYVALARDQIYCSVFKNDDVGRWVARHGMSGADYQSAFDRNVADGLYPICVQGGGTSSWPVYAAIFAQTDIGTPKG